MDKIRENCEKTPSVCVSSRTGHTEMAKHCPPHPLLERGNVVYVAGALSQVSKPRSTRRLQISSTTVDPAKLLLLALSRMVKFPQKILDPDRPDQHQNQMLLVRYLTRQKFSPEYVDNFLNITFLLWNKVLLID